MSPHPVSLLYRAAGPVHPGRALGGLACLLAACLGLAALASASGDPGPVDAKSPPTAPARTEAPADEPPLPAEAVARVGSARLRHAASVTSVACSADGRWIASADDLGTVCVWDADTGKLRHRFPGKARSWYHVVAFGPDGKTLFSLAGDESQINLNPGWVRAFDLATGKERPFPAKVPDALVGRGSLSPDGTLFGYSDGQGKYHVYAAASGKLVRTLALGQPFPGPWSAALAPGGGAAAVAGGEKLKVFDLKTGKEVARLDGGGRQARAMAFSTDGQTLGVVWSDAMTWENTLALWDRKAGRVVRHITGLEPTTACLAFSPDGKRIAAGNWQRLHVQLFDAGTGKELRRFRSWPGAMQVAFTPDGKGLVAGRSEGSVSVWDVETGRPRPASANPDASISELRFTREGLLVIASEVAVHDWRTGKVVRRYPDPRTHTWAGFALSADGRRMAVAEAKGAVRVLDAASGRAIRSFAGHTILADSVRFSDDGRRLLSRGFEGTARVWDVEAGRELHRLAVGSNRDRSEERLAASADGKLLATAAWEGEGDVVRIWDAVRGRELHRWTSVKDLHGLAFSPDGSLLAAGGSNSPRLEAPGNVTLWDTATGKERRSLTVPTACVLTVAISPDGRMLASGGIDPAVRLWEVATGKERHALKGHEGRVYALAFSPDGRHLASASSDAPVFVWDVYGLGGPAAKAADGEPGRLWEALAAADSAEGFRAVRRLAALPGEAVALLRANLRAALPPDEKHVRRLLADLDSGRFAVRQRATAELEQMAPDIEPLLREALRAAAAEEVRRRLAQVLARVDDPGPGRLRELRAVEVLERAATPEALRLLGELARGAPRARLTREAAAALGRSLGR